MTSARSAMPQGTERIAAFARRFLLLTIVVIGAMCGVLAVLFHGYLELARRFLIGAALAQHGMVRVVLAVAVPPAVFMLLALVIRRFAPRAVCANLARARVAFNAY